MKCPLCSNSQKRNKNNTFQPLIVECPFCYGTGHFYRVEPRKRPMKVLVACEYSGRVRDAFIQQGHNAMSCDLIASEKPGPHYIGDVFDILYDEWDLLIAHPPCTHLSVSGAAWFYYKKGVQISALQFVQDLMNAPIHRICIENPVSIISTCIKKPTQIIEPFHFGHPVSKATCLWLKGVPPLRATCVLSFYQGIGKVAYTAKDKSRTFEGVAQAMATQW